MAPVVLVKLSYQYIFHLCLADRLGPIMGSSPSAENVGEISLVLRGILCESGVLGIMRSWKCLLDNYYYAYFEITIITLSLNVQFTISRDIVLITIIVTVDVLMIVVGFTGHTIEMTSSVSSECGSCDWDHISEWEHSPGFTWLRGGQNDKKVT